MQNEMTAHKNDGIREHSVFSGKFVWNNMILITAIYEYEQRTMALSTPEYLNRFRFGFTLFPMMWTVKNGFDADPFYQDRKAVW